MSVPKSMCDSRPKLLNLWISHSERVVTALLTRGLSNRSLKRSWGWVNIWSIICCLLRCALVFIGKLLLEVLHFVLLLSNVWRSHLAFERIETFRKLLDIPGRISTRVDRGPFELAHPLLGPLFMGCLLKAHSAFVRVQLEHGSEADSLGASQRI